MSKPTTEAGRALMEAMLRRGLWWVSPGDTIVAIEAEAAAQERERIARAIERLPTPPYTPGGLSAVYRVAVLAIVRGEQE